MHRPMNAKVEVDVMTASSIAEVLMLLLLTGSGQVIFIDTWTPQTMHPWHASFQGHMASFPVVDSS